MGERLRRRLEIQIVALDKGGTDAFAKVHKILGEIAASGIGLNTTLKWVKSNVASMTAAVENNLLKQGAAFDEAKQKAEEYGRETIENLNKVAIAAAKKQLAKADPIAKRTVAATTGGIAVELSKEILKGRELDDVLAMVSKRAKIVGDDYYKALRKAGVSVDVAREATKKLKQETVTSLEKMLVSFAMLRNQYADLANKMRSNKFITDKELNQYKLLLGKFMADMRGMWTGTTKGMRKLLRDTLLKDMEDLSSFVGAQGMPKAELSGLDKLITGAEKGARKRKFVTPEDLLALDQLEKSLMRDARAADLSEKELGELTAKIKNLKAALTEEMQAANLTGRNFDYMDKKVASATNTYRKATKATKENQREFEQKIAWLKKDVVWTNLDDKAQAHFNKTIGDTRKHLADVVRATEAATNAKKKGSKTTGDYATRMGHLRLTTANLRLALGVIRNEILLFTFAIGSTVAFFTRSITAAKAYEAALTGLTAVAQNLHMSTLTATKSARDLATDGLIAVTEAAAGLKNLLATGLSLPQAIQLMYAFKDVGAFNRQGALSLGEAVVGATEGFKNMNSIMIDNIGLTRNAGVILLDYARSLGKSRE